MLDRHSAPLSSPETRMRFCECCHSDNSENGEAFYDICKDCLEILQSRPSSPDFDPMCEECCDPVIPCSRHKAASPPAELTEALDDVRDALRVTDDAKGLASLATLESLYTRQREEIATVRANWNYASQSWTDEVDQLNERIFALSSHLERLTEWKTSVLSSLESKPDFVAGEWEGDKRGWGYVFEYINWLHRDRERLKADSLTAEQADILLGLTFGMAGTGAEFAARERLKQISLGRRLSSETGE